ncbi:hypothetical protein HY491_01230 [Candidatus Woesearchaeota archaeon]|nr:hypothetical protein [Candidatus Woesearchaeota archaeon]
MLDFLHAFLMGHVDKTIYNKFEGRSLTIRSIEPELDGLGVKTEKNDIRHDYGTLDFSYKDYLLTPTFCPHFGIMGQVLKSQFEYLMSDIPHMPRLSHPSYVHHSRIFSADLAPHGTYFENYMELSAACRVIEAVNPNLTLRPVRYRGLRPYKAHDFHITEDTSSPAKNAQELEERVLKLLYAQEVLEGFFLARLKESEIRAQQIATAYLKNLSQQQ